MSDDNSLIDFFNQINSQLPPMSYKRRIEDIRDTFDPFGILAPGEAHPGGPEYFARHYGFELPTINVPGSVFLGMYFVKPWLIGIAGEKDASYFWRKFKEDDGLFSEHDDYQYVTTARPSSYRCVRHWLTDEPGLWLINMEITSSRRRARMDYKRVDEISWFLARRAALVGRAQHDETLADDIRFFLAGHRFADPGVWLDHLDIDGANNE